MNKRTPMIAILACVAASRQLDELDPVNQGEPQQALCGYGNSAVPQQARQPAMPLLPVEGVAQRGPVSLNIVPLCEVGGESQSGCDFASLPAETGEAGGLIMSRPPTPQSPEEQRISDRLPTQQDIPESPNSTLPEYLDANCDGLSGLSSAAVCAGSTEGRERCLLRECDGSPLPSCSFNWDSWREAVERELHLNNWAYYLQHA